MSKTRYVAGFLFNEDYTQVALIRKTHPKWQAGKLNGVGGKIDPGENSHQAMEREFEEEAGFTFTEWKAYAELFNDEFVVYFFTGRKDVPDISPYLASMTEEDIEIHPILVSQSYDVVPNLSWLIPLAIQSELNYAKIKYKG